jgi:LAO/AO transport system kinase
VKYDIAKLVAGTLSQEERSLSQLISIIENDNDGEDTADIRKAISPNLGKAYRLGVTGTPGSGKSTLIGKLTSVIRGRGLTVGAICIDPTSPLRGGSVLGDRIRMEQNFSDSGVFIRSMATRGSYGGIAKSVDVVLDVMDAYGKDVIIVETVGKGQEEISITRIVQKTILVLNPDWGDSLQLMKAGILEVADFIVINKADCLKEGLIEELREILALGSRESMPPILMTQALNNYGIEELWQALEKQRPAQ